MREEMINRIAEKIKEEVGVECEVRMGEVVRNNGLVSQAMGIIEPGAYVYPRICIDDLLKGIELGEISIQEAVQEILRIYRKYRNNERFANIFRSNDKQHILGKVTYQLVNMEKNRRMLCNMPHREFLDLAVIYRVTVGEDEFERDSFMVNKEICERYKISETELEYAAARNTEKLGFEILPMTSILNEIKGGQEEVCEYNHNIWVLTSTYNLNGATVMLYNEYFSRLAKNIGSDLYILPSSIHEVLAVPIDGIEPSELKEIVSIVNSSDVPENEVLSENVYRYSLKENKLIIA